MALKETLQQLGAERSTPCVSISLNTHRARPKTEQDRILLKNLLKEAHDRVSKEYDKKAVGSLLKKISTIKDTIDMNANLDSLHIFLSNDTQEVVKSPWEASNDRVNISNQFAIRPLIKAYNRSEPYLIMVLSQSKVSLYEAVNDGIIQEIKNEDFPVTQNIPATLYPEKLGDAKYVDDLTRSFFNIIDKGLVKVHQATDLKCVVVTTEDNYSKLMQVADKPNTYHGYVSINTHKQAPHQIVKETWKFIEKLQSKRRTEAIEEVKKAISQGNVLTDLQEIYQAAMNGRGDLLVVNQNFRQSVIMNDNNSFELVDDASTLGAVDDITSKIAWEVISKKGRAIFTEQEELKDLGKIVLKTRY
ncbi:MAG: hypothetical protein PHI32_07430 [Dysgonamonadaceae bacterium]|nr:hypothetical protein [Dysgonamonadaceae bacterium]MDD4728254.1 hypothetical protein [Dysgonamonadaceae bacterium]